MTTLVSYNNNLPNYCSICQEHFNHGCINNNKFITNPQKWNFEIEPIIGYATKFFEKYNSTSWYHGIRSSTTGYPTVWYDDFLNVSFP